MCSLAENNNTAFMIILNVVPPRVSILALAPAAEAGLVRDVNSIKIIGRKVKEIRFKNWVFIGKSCYFPKNRVPIGLTFATTRVILSIGVPTMEADSTQKNENEQIATSMACPKGWICRDKGLEEIAAAGVVIVGDTTLLECFSEDAKFCQFSRSYGEGYLCQCPFRYYAAKESNE